MTVKLDGNEIYKETKTRVERNEVQSKRFQGIKIQGIALEAGSAGQWISVQNANSGKQISVNIDQEGLAWVE